MSYGQYSSVLLDWHTFQFAWHWRIKWEWVLKPRGFNDVTLAFRFCSRLLRQFLQACNFCVRIYSNKSNPFTFRSSPVWICELTLECFSRSTDVFNNQTAANSELLSQTFPNFLNWKYLYWGSVFIAFYLLYSFWIFLRAFRIFQFHDPYLAVCLLVLSVYWRKCASQRLGKYILILIRLWPAHCANDPLFDCAVC